jgi:hypothetical protein
VAYTRRKKIKGHYYLEVVESYRKDGKVRHHYLGYIGTEEKSHVNEQRNRTSATGITAKNLLISHDPYTFAPNQNYPRELQPRFRDRTAARLQVMNIAVNLDPDALLTDFRSVDRGAPIVGSDGVVESGNGRAMALLRAAEQYPEMYSKYLKALRVIAPKYYLSVALIEELKVPMLVRERLTPVDRRAFVEECNARPTMEVSPIEKARIDAAKLSLDILESLELLEGEAITDAVRSLRNKHVVTAFLSRFPANEQSGLLDTHGILNQDGVMRIVRAIFVATFQSDAGLWISERFLESTDVNVRNCFNGISRSLGMLARIEALISKGYRRRDYTICEDLAKSIVELIIIKNTPGMTLPRYLAQAQMLERKLTSFQERVLAVLDQNCRSAKQISAILSHYCQAVIDSPSPSQMSWISEAAATKEEMFETAVKSVISQ